MGFSVQVVPDVVEVEPGHSHPVTVTIVNDGPETHSLELSVEGIDGEWLAIPVSEITLDPHATHQERFFFKPPREPNSVADSYPYVVRVRNLETGEARNVQGILQVKTFHHLTMEITPKKASVSPLRKGNQYDAVVVNLSNTPHTLKMSGIDPEDACTYEFEADEIALAPGQQREISFVPTPKRQSFASGTRLVGFTISGRSVQNPAVSTVAQAQLEVRPVLTPFSLIVGLIILLVGWFWWINLPRPPAVSLTVNPMTALVGDNVNIAWSADPQSRVRITAGPDTVLYEGDQESGQKDLTLTEELVGRDGKLIISVVATKSGIPTEETVTLTVNRPEPIPDPEILRLTPSATSIELGKSFLLRYQFSPSVVSATLVPGNVNLDPAMPQWEVTPSEAGNIEYTVTAKNKAGKSVVKTFRVNVVQKSKAVILVFRADRTKVTAPETTIRLEWQVSNASRVELKQTGTAPVPVEVEGASEIAIGRKTTFTLIAYDENGLQVTRDVTVDYEEAMPDEPTAEPPTPGTPPISGNPTSTTPPPGTTSTTAGAGGRR